MALTKGMFTELLRPSVSFWFRFAYFEAEHPKQAKKLRKFLAKNDDVQAFLEGFAGPAKEAARSEGSKTAEEATRPQAGSTASSYRTFNEPTAGRLTRYRSSAAG